MKNKKISLLSFFKKSKSSEKGGKNNTLPKAIAFVDYEHWYIALDKIHHLRPDIQSWFDDIQSRCNIVEVIFFGNFSKFREKEKEIRRIRTFTNKIIDTYNPDSHYKKDYTDFIILDNIYQKAVSDNDVETFILFTGDGHFSSVCAFLKNFCSKDIGLYGVKGAISGSLVKNAAWVSEIPYEKEVDSPYYNMIFTYLKELEENIEVQPTFMKTSALIAAKNNVPEDKIKKLMLELIEQGYILQIMGRSKRNSPIRIMKPDWKMIADSGLWQKDAIIV